MTREMTAFSAFLHHQKMSGDGSYVYLSTNHLLLADNENNNKGSN
jgi:hypothetical protein